MTVSKQVRSGEAAPMTGAQCQCTHWCTVHGGTVTASTQLPSMPAHRRKVQAHLSLVGVRKLLLEGQVVQRELRKRGGSS